MSGPARRIWNFCVRGHILLRTHSGAEGRIARLFGTRPTPEGSRTHAERDILLPCGRFMKRSFTGLAAVAVSALLAVAGGGAAAAADLTAAECAAAWKKSSAAESCGAQAGSSEGAGLPAARISVVTRTVTAPHPLFPWSTLDVEVQFCRILVQCLHSGQTAAAGSVNCPTGFLGGLEDVKKAVNEGGTLKSG